MSDNSIPEAAIAPVLSTIPCRKCGTTIGVDAQFCSQCGYRQDQGSAWYYHPVWILLLAFLVLGPFALPLVWRSSKMNPVMKIVMALVILAYSYYICYATYRLTAFAFKDVGELNDVLRQMRQIK